jgi:hypothetical protein
MSLTLQAKKVIPPPIWTILKSSKRAAIRSLRKSWGVLGLNVARRADFYSPLPVYEELLETRDQWNRPSALRGVKYDLDEMEKRLANLSSRRFEDWSHLPPYSEAVNAGFGPGYPPIDAMILFMMLREIKPKRYLEIGSGLSTYYANLAAAENSREGAPLQITCIEPYPYAQLNSIPGIKLCAQKVQEVSLDEFSKLERSDVLFIDSSHALKVGSDVTYLLLEALPALQPGVWTHIHDVPFPYNIPYPPEFWIEDRNWPIYWNEAMAVQAFLAFNNRFEIHLSVPLLRHFREDSLRSHIPGYESPKRDDSMPSALWLQS